MPDATRLSPLHCAPPRTHPHGLSLTVTLISASHSPRCRVPRSMAVLEPESPVVGLGVPDPRCAALPSSVRCARHLDRWVCRCRIPDTVGRRGARLTAGWTARGEDYTETRAMRTRAQVETEFPSAHAEGIYVRCLLRWISSRRPVEVHKSKAPTFYFTFTKFVYIDSKV